jgi:hypothetical protein
MVGAGIYPPDIFNRARVCRHLHLLPDPFDVAIQTQVVPMTWNTKLIQHNWSTKSYKLEGNKAVCESSTARPTSKDYAQPVNLGPNGPCVLHGCKDTTLHRIISSLVSSAPAPEEEPGPEPTVKRRRKANGLANSN